ncbi:hypothetical protein [Saccharomonospora saliphila]|uniref:hypothetical protein n=1 Tax=Saccharomonospora saliphila TaxID=369829 RepID=UPI0003641CC3|nr:hypothetical protein [Saccharomonospora saliphila]
MCNEFCGPFVGGLLVAVGSAVALGMPIGTGAIGLLAEVVGMRAAFLVFATAVLIAIPPFLRTVTPDVLAGVERARQRQLAEHRTASDPRER